MTKNHNTDHRKQRMGLDWDKYKRKNAGTYGFGPPDRTPNSRNTS